MTTTETWAAPELWQTPRLRLRPYRITDLDDALTFHGDEPLLQYMPWPVRDRAQTLEQIEKKAGNRTAAKGGEVMQLAIERADTGRVIGEAVIIRSDDAGELAELGWVLAAAEHGQGLAKEAALGLLDIVRGYGAHTARARIHPDNAPSRALAERLGMRLSSPELNESGLLTYVMPVR